MEEKTDLRVLKTRKSLYTTFMEMLRVKSFDSITVNELCDRALVRRATFYRHYLDKYDFFAHFVRYMRDERLAPAGKDTENLSPQDYCIMYFTNFLEFVRANNDLIQNVLHSNSMPVLLDIFSQEIYSHVAEIMKDSHVLPESVPVSVAASFYAGGMIQTIRYSLSEPNALTEEQMIEGVRTLLYSIQFEEKDKKAASRKNPAARSQRTGDFPVTSK